MAAAKSKQQYKIATLGSHSALQIMKGARDEGFGTVLVCERARSRPYRSFRVADRIIELDSFREIRDIQDELVKENVILVPHGSLFNVMGLLELETLPIKYFGNKRILPWEESRIQQRKWLKKAGLTLPKIYNTAEEIDGPCIIKFNGAGGGKGYFLASNADEFRLKIAPHRERKYIIQQYIVGAPLYVHYFYSPLTNELEVMSMDKRYETNVDSIGRISAKDQLDLNLETSYNIMGNLPLVVRESLLSEIFDMGDRVVEASQRLEPPDGLIGPFCLEMVITPDLEFFVFEISARIVAGTNPYINGSPYSDLRYDVPMSTGRRVAREVKLALESNQLDKILVNGHTS